MRFIYKVYFDVSPGSAIDVGPYKTWADEFVGERGVDWQLVWHEANRYRICFTREEDLIVFKIKFGL